MDKRTRNLTLTVLMGNTSQAGFPTQRMSLRNEDEHRPLQTLQSGESQGPHLGKPDGVLGELSPDELVVCSSHLLYKWAIA